MARKRVGRKRFYRVSGAGSAPALFVKVFSIPRGVPRLRALLGRSKARRELDVAGRVAALGFDVGAPLAIGEEWTAGLPSRSISMVAEKPGRDLREVLRDPATTSSTRRALIESFAAVLRRIHDAGIDQDDTSPNNFLITADGRWILIDFERCRVGAPLGKRRWKLLAKLQRHELGVSRPNRLRFLSVYLGAENGRDARRSAWEQIFAEFERIRRRDARRAGRAAFRVGRQVGRDGRRWFVRGREDAAVIRISTRPRDGRRLWKLAHQLERLALPALRPVQLDDHGVELEHPGPDIELDERDAAIGRARKRFALYGSFVGEPDWALTREGALLRDPRSFRLRSWYDRPSLR